MGVDADPSPASTYHGEFISAGASRGICSDINSPSKSREIVTTLKCGFVGKMSMKSSFVSLEGIVRFALSSIQSFVVDDLASASCVSRFNSFRVGMLPQCVPR